MTISPTSNILSFWPRKPWASNASIATFSDRRWTETKIKIKLCLDVDWYTYEWSSHVYKIHETFLKILHYCWDWWWWENKSMWAAYVTVSSGVLLFSWQFCRRRSGLCWIASEIWRCWPCPGDPSELSLSGDWKKRGSYFCFFILYSGYFVHFTINLSSFVWL